MGADSISSAFSAWLMTYNPWIPMFAGWAFMVMGIMPALSLPETMNSFPTAKPPQETHELPNLPDDVEHSPSRTKWRLQDTIMSKIRSKIISTFHEFEFILQDKQLLLLLCTFLVYKLSRGTAWFLVQYVSNRYKWTIAQANFLVSLKSVITVILFVVILPTSSWYLVNRRKLHTREKDLFLTKSSIIFLMVGTLGIGLSPSVFLMISCLIVQTLGAGFVFVARSLITTMIQREQTARLYVIIEILEAVGMIIAGPTIAAFFKWGLELGGSWIGLPWIVASGLFFLTATAVSIYKMPPIPREDGYDEIET
jgi:hypothetical protein